MTFNLEPNPLTAPPDVVSDDFAWQRREFVNGDGTHLQAYAAGHRSAPAIVLVNAHGIAHGVWTPLARALARDYRVLTWESRHFPSAEADSSRLDTRSHVADLLAMLCAFDVGRPLALLGWCTGAHIALRGLHQHPELAQALVLLHGAFRFGDAVPLTEYQQFMRDIMQRLVQRPSSAPAYLRVVAGQLAPAHRELDPEYRALRALTQTGLQDPSSFLRYAQLLAAYYAEPEDLAGWSVDLPTLVVTGDRDAIAHPAMSYAAAKRLPRAAVETIRGGDHYTLWKGQMIAATTTTFLEKARSAL